VRNAPDNFPEEQVMNKMIVTATAVLIIMIAAATAQDNVTGGLTLPDNAPNEYTVKKGDTLWDISGKFLGNPFDWPKVWKHNTYIADPHWIYPGQIITLRTIMKLAVPPAPVVPPEPLPAPEPRFAPVAVKDAPEKPSAPETAETPVMKAASVRADDGNVILALNEPRAIYTLKSYMRTGYIAQLADIPRSSITGLDHGLVSATKYDIVEVKPANDVRFNMGDMLSVYSTEDRVRHPDTGRRLGVVLRVKGIMEVVSSVNGRVKCRVTENFDPLLEGDLVAHSRLRKAPHFDAWVKPDRIINGTIIARNEPILSIHQGDILFIDKGTNEAVRAGDRFAIYRRETAGVKQNREPLGELEAVNVMPGETAAMVISHGDKSVNIGDRVELVARCRIVE